MRAFALPAHALRSLARDHDPRGPGRVGAARGCLRLPGRPSPDPRLLRRDDPRHVRKTSPGPTTSTSCSGTTSSSIETEYDFAPDGWGPFDVLSGFARLEVRYDCVWTRACGIFPSANAFGDRVAHLPGYKTNGHRTRHVGHCVHRQSGGLRDGSFASQARRHRSLHGAPLRARRRSARQREQPAGARSRGPDSSRTRADPGQTDQVDGLVGLFAIAGHNGIFEANGDVEYTSDLNAAGNIEFGTINDDPAYFYFSGQTRCRFGSRKIPGGANGVGSQTHRPDRSALQDRSGVVRCSGSRIRSIRPTRFRSS